MEYIIIRCGTLPDLVDSVNKRIHDGFKPLGGPVFYPVYSDNSGKSWIQAMTKEEGIENA
jgi:hypothetical protein